MAATFTPDSATIGSTEYFLMSDSTSQVAQTSQGLVQVLLDFAVSGSAMAAGDSFQITVYEKVNGGAQQPAMQPAVVSGVQSQLYTTPLIFLGEGWDIGVKKISGNDRTVGWSVRRDDTGASASAIAAAVAAFVNDSNAPANAQTIQQILNIIISAVGAPGTGLASDGSVIIKNTANTKNRIAGTVGGGARSGVTYDGTP